MRINVTSYHNLIVMKSSCTLGFWTNKSGQRSQSYGEADLITILNMFFYR